jgi:hypothetical protein
MKSLKRIQICSMTTKPKRRRAAPRTERGGDFEETSYTGSTRQQPLTQRMSVSSVEKASTDRAATMEPSRWNCGNDGAFEVEL